MSKSKHTIFDDEEKSKLLQKLLQSKNPDDLQAANRLIKTMVREVSKKCLKDYEALSENLTIVL